MKKRLTLSITLILSLLMALLTTGMAFASEGNEIEVIGEIVNIYPEEFYFEIEAEIDGVVQVLIVQVGQNFDFDTLVVGDLIEVKGTLNEDGVLVLTELKIQERARDQVKAQEGELESYYCTTEDQFHPVALKAADTYGVDYGVIEGYLCSENPVPLGQIMLALQTAALDETIDFTLYLNGFENISWGQIWQDLGVQGKPDHGTAPGQIKQQDGENVPEETGEKGKKNGQEDLEEEGLFLDWLPQNWFQKGKK